MKHDSHIQPDQMSDDQTAILNTIERETTAFLMRDFATWSECWVQDPGARRLGSNLGGMLDYLEGWEDGSDTVTRIFERFPEPNPESARTIRRSNVSVRVSGDMAWVSFDQYGEKSDDPLVVIGLSHQIRILERQDSVWRIVMAGHGDTGLDYHDYPTIRIDAKCRVDWMNEAAREELQTHPALMKSGAFLRCRYPGEDKRLRAAVAEVANLTLMERRPSLRHPKGRTADPLVLNGDGTSGQHVIWISVQYSMLLVTFRDRKNEMARLQMAAELFALSPAQLKVAEIMITGSGLPDVADQLGISHSTARTHLNRIFDKTGTRTQTALIAKMLGIERPA